LAIDVFELGDKVHNILAGLYQFNHIGGKMTLVTLYKRLPWKLKGILCDTL